VTALRLIAGQVRYQLRLLARSPIAAFATLVIPLMVLLAVGLLYNGSSVGSRGNIPYIQFFTPAMVAFATVTACYTGVITSTILARELGILKRLRSTPLPPWAYMGGRLVAAAFVTVASTVAVIAVGAGVYGFHFMWSALPAVALTLALAIVCFCALALAVTVLIPTAEAALPIAWGTLLPLCFVSDVFQPIAGAPEWLRATAGSFPVKALADQLERLFNPTAHGPMLDARHLELMLVWTIGATLFALVAFRWDPTPVTPGRRASRALTSATIDRIREALTPHTGRRAQ
jgi:ABC-2 type transport system permease protein